MGNFYSGRLAVRRYLEQSPGPHTCTDLMKVLGISSGTASGALLALIQDGEVVRTGRGGQTDPYVYHLVPGSTSRARKPQTRAAREAARAEYRDFWAKQRVREANLEGPSASVRRTRSKAKHATAETVEDFLARGGSVERL